MQRKYLSHGLGIPFSRQFVTDGCLISHNLATAEVPPIASIMRDAVFLSSSDVLMENIIDKTKRRASRTNQK